MIWKARKNAFLLSHRYLHLKPQRRRLIFFISVNSVRISVLTIGSVSSRECLDAPAILATFTAGRTGLVACPCRHYNFNNYADNPHVICLNFICIFFYRLEKKRNEKSMPEMPS